MATKVIFCNRLPGTKSIRRQIEAKKLILICDKKLRQNRKLVQWTKTADHIIWVQGGEKLKTVSAFAVHAEKIIDMSKGYDRREIALVAVGGGSVGDYTGFLASVIKRGVKLVHVPTTWLAAVDSAHGGKTALNLGFTKNQIGTFYSSLVTYCVRDILRGQPQQLAVDAYSEFAKVALLTGGRLYLRMARLKEINGESLWSVLPLAVEAKMRFVRRDPKELTDVRTALNLGHTLAHALELNHKISHGAAVGVGLRFAIFWSCERGLLSTEKAQSINGLLPKLPSSNFSFSEAGLRRAFLRDKKTYGGKKLRFVFLKASGRPEIQFVSIDAIVKAVKRWKKAAFIL